MAGLADGGGKAGLVFDEMIGRQDEHDGIWPLRLNNLVCRKGDGGSGIAAKGLKEESTAHADAFLFIPADEVVVPIGDGEDVPAQCPRPFVGFLDEAFAIGQFDEGLGVSFPRRRP